MQFFPGNFIEEYPVLMWGLSWKDGKQTVMLARCPSGTVKDNTIPASAAMTSLWFYEHANPVNTLGQNDAAWSILEEKPAAGFVTAEANCWLYNLMHLV